MQVENGGGACRKIGQSYWREIADRHVDVGVFVKNLTNRIYAINIQDETATPLGYASDIYGDPRTFGAQVRFHFQPS